MQRRFVVCVAALALTLAFVATATAMERPFKIGFGGGVSVPVSDAKSAFDNGFHAKAMFQWKTPALPIALGGSLGYEKFDLKSLTAGSTGSGRILSALGNVSYEFPVGPIKPYVTAGLGAFNMNSSVDGVSGTAQTKFGIDGGLGVKFNLGSISAFAEAKIENIYTDQGLAQSFNTQVVPVTFGVLF
jgi:opacity protein-like surface antigen